MTIYSKHLQTAYIEFELMGDVYTSLLKQTDITS